MTDHSAAKPNPAGLPERAKLFMAGTAAAAGAVGALAVMHGTGEERGWPAFLILVAAASITQLFAFHTIRNQVFHTTPLFFVAGAVLLKPEFALLLPLVSHIGDWIRQRYAWYIQTFNILNFTLAVMSAWWVARLVADDWLAGKPQAWAAGGAAAALAYVIVNNAGFATILFLARGHSPRSILTPQVLAADAVLRGVADVIRSHAREYDIDARLGGEEFAIMLPETSRTGAMEIARRIREAVASTPFWAPSVEEHVTATLSIGVAAFPEDG